jgi:hypothetical protein
VERVLVQPDLEPVSEDGGRGSRLRLVLTAALAGLLVVGLLAASHSQRAESGDRIEMVP